jgi:hypothetical protein
MHDPEVVPTGRRRLVLGLRALAVALTVAAAGGCHAKPGTLPVDSKVYAFHAPDPDDLIDTDEDDGGDTDEGTGAETPATPPAAPEGAGAAAAPAPTAPAAPAKAAPAKKAPAKKATHKAPATHGKG